MLVKRKQEILWTKKSYKRNLSFNWPFLRMFVNMWFVFLFFIIFLNCKKKFSSVKARSKSKTMYTCDFAKAVRMHWISSCCVRCLCCVFDANVVQANCFFFSFAFLYFVIFVIRFIGKGKKSYGFLIFDIKWKGN